MSLKLNEVFFTFQGEGEHWGRRALFVRLPYCNLKCSFCDTEFNSFEEWSEEKFKEFAIQEKCRFAVITGGEPTMNKQTPKVIQILKDLGYELAIESNGNFPIPNGIDFVTISPKRDAKYYIHADAALKANEIKVVVDKNFDFDVIRNLQNHEWTKLVRLSLSPEFGNMKESLLEMESFIKENPRWRISLQTHKFMGVR